MCFLAAAKSTRRKFVGKLSKAMNSIPVERPQDLARTGEGTIKVQGKKVMGYGTKFMELFGKGSSLVISQPGPLKVEYIVSI